MTCMVDDWICMYVIQCLTIHVLATAAHVIIYVSYSILRVNACIACVCV